MHFYILVSLTFLSLYVCIEGSKLIPTNSSAISWEATQTRVSRSRISLLETQETQETQATFTEHSSISRYPLFSFSVRSITPLSSVLQLAQNQHSAPIKCSFVAAIIDTQGPDSISIKKGASAGTKIERLQLTVGDEDNIILLLTAWRETAEIWGNATAEVGLKKGDVVYFENISAQLKEGAVVLSASPYLKSKSVICFRILPYAHENGYLQPDLRLGQRDAAVQKVASMVSWYKHMEGTT